MNILVIGSGGREHAIGVSLRKDKRINQIYFAPGNGGTTEIGINVDIKVDEIDKLIGFAISNKIDYTVVGPELPLIMGISDAFISNGLKIFGVNKSAARLEGSKAFAKEFMSKYNLPTARYKTYIDVNSALKGLDSFSFPLVIKADGIAAGKGVIICNDKTQAVNELNAIFNGKFGIAGNTVVIEEFLQGYEASLMCFIDGKSGVVMPSAQDYKRIYDGDKGLNTGGMGAISPALHYLEQHKQTFESVILPKTLDALRNEGIDFRGILYFGLMLSGDKINILEFNARFGDPETQAVLIRLKTLLIDIIDATINGKLDSINIKWDSNPSACVVIASSGYPESYKTGEQITINSVNSTVFHAGTKIIDGKLVTAGGRVLVVASLGTSISDAAKRIYSDCKKIKFSGMHYRKDIGSLKEINMKEVYVGKTKNVYQLPNGNYALLFKDDCTGSDGVFDPGANSVGLVIEGIGKHWLRITEYFFKLINKTIPTHFVSADIANSLIEVLPAQQFGKGIEVICRYKSTGSFMRRFGGYATEGQDLNGIVEITLKDDDRGDPVISMDILNELKIMDNETYLTLKKMTLEICGIIRKELAKRGAELYDIKLEFGKNNGKIILIDEISGGNMRVYKDGKKLSPFEISKLILG